MRVSAQRPLAVELKTVLTFLATVRKTAFCYWGSHSCRTLPLKLPHSKTRTNRMCYFKWVLLTSNSLFWRKQTSSIWFGDREMQTFREKTYTRNNSFMSYQQIYSFNQWNDWEEDTFPSTLPENNLKIAASKKNISALVRFLPDVTSLFVGWSLHKKCARRRRVFEVGRNSVTKYKSGTNWCNKCTILSDKEFASPPLFTPRKQKKKKWHQKIR